MASRPTTTRPCRPMNGDGGSYSCVAASRNTSPSVVCAIAILMFLDAQLRAVEADAVSLANMDKVTRKLTQPALEELIRCLNRALTLISEALK
jgi:hypothetical protein